MKSFHEFEKFHEGLLHIFRSHQLAVVVGETSVAIRLFDSFQSELAHHMRDEDEHLLPAFMLLAPNEQGGTPEAFRLEHEKLDRLLESVRRLVMGLKRSTDAESILAIIEEEARFKNLLAHHFERERNVLFPALDRLVSQADRERIFKQCVTEANVPTEALALLH